MNEVKDGKINGTVVEKEEATATKNREALRLSENVVWTADKWVYFTDHLKWAGVIVRDDLQALEIKVATPGGRFLSTTQLYASEETLTSVRELIATGEDQVIGNLLFKYMQLISEHMIEIPKKPEDAEEYDDQEGVMDQEAAELAGDHAE